MSVTKTLENFRIFLEVSWDRITAVTDARPDGDSLLDDWLQANWELLVEASVCSTPNEFLEIYGDGADCNSPSSRVWKPDATPTHQIYCIALSHDGAEDKFTGRSISIEELTFGRFVNWEGKKYGSSPPFNSILLERSNEIFLVSVNDVRFDIRPI